VNDITNKLEIKIIKGEEFFAFDNAEKFLESEEAVSKVSHVYFRHKGFVEGCSSNEDEPVGVFLQGYVYAEIEDCGNSLVINGEGFTDSLFLYDGKAKNNNYTENDFEYYKADFIVDRSETDVYIKKSDLEDVSKQYGIPIKDQIEEDEEGYDCDDEEVTPKERTTFFNIIGILYEFIGVGEESPKTGKEMFHNMIELINYMEDKYPNVPGIKQRTLSPKFKEALEKCKDYN